MKKIIVMVMVFSLCTLNVGYHTGVYAQNEAPQADEKVMEKIEAEAVAKELAARAEGTYVKGEAEPVLKGNQVALPIIDEDTGNTLGYVVAEKDKLVSVLNEAGLTDVANALAAMDAGEAAGETVKAGMSRGTITWIAIGGAALAALALALGSGGGGGGGGSTSNH